MYTFIAVIVAVIAFFAIIFLLAAWLEGVEVT